MASEEKKTSVELERQIAGHLQSGFFTHVFAECGQLNEAEPRYRYSHLPEHRDLFDLSSLTKALVTTPLVFREFKRLGLDLDSTISQWMNVAGLSGTDLLSSRAIRNLSVKSLLRHESGLPYWQNFYVACAADSKKRDLLEGLKDAAARLPNLGKSVYCDPGFILLGLCLEASGRSTLDVLFNAFLKKELKIDVEQFPLGYSTVLNQALPERAISTGHCSIRQRQLLGEVHDENCWALGGVTGHAGLFGSGPSVSHYLKSLSGTPLGRAVLTENAAAILAGPNEPLMGWRQGADSSSETFGGGRAMGHMGFTGVAFWVAVGEAGDGEQKTVNEHGKYSILLTNRVVSGRTSPLTRPFRREAFAALWLLAQP